MDRNMRIQRAGAVAWAVALAVGASASPCDIAGGSSVRGIGLASILGQWTGAGTYSPCPPVSVYDLNGDCRVNGLDLAIYLGAWGTPCLPIVTQLAGNNLTQYPFFEYVRAFNQGTFIRLALDPNRYPAIVGKTCDLYIVAHKTATQWAADRSLMDLTTGGFQTQTFVAGGVQDNSFTISGATTLNGTMGTQIGVGYDMVCDCNQNGLLDAGDFIDGTLDDSLPDEAGLYVVRDTAAPGPLAVTASPSYVVTGISDLGQDEEKAYYPTDIASMGQLPLILVAHGAGANYLWWNHIGTHMASYGYIVVAHQTWDAPGVSNCAVTTLQHTNAFIGQQGTILGGVFNGHVDANNIIWMGFSRGGEGVTIAYDHLFDGTPLILGPHIPVGWSVNSIRLISTMAPLDFLGPNSSNPHGVPFHVFIGAGDADANGCASSDVAQWYHLHDRAESYRQSTAIYGAGHGDFHALGGSFTGPCPIGVANVNRIMKGYLVPLAQHHLFGDIPAKDFLWRQWERFRPLGAPAPGTCNPPSGTGEALVVNLMYRDGPSAGNFIIDDYQANPAPGISSSGGTVSWDVANLVEGQLNDANTDFTWTPADPMNGMTMARSTDTSAGVVFDWNGPAFYEQQIAPGHEDFRPFAYLSFRACQGTRHPHTIAALEDLTFDVVLRDAAGRTSRINIGAYGGGIEEPYQRTTCGAGVGWNNEFETIRIRLTDFLNNGSGLELAQIVAVRFEFAAPASGTSAVGRIGLDEIELTRD